MRTTFIVVAALAVGAMGCGDDNGGMLTGGSGGDGAGGTGGASVQDVTIEFVGMVGEAEFECGTVYENLGSNNTSLELTDFRLHVQNVALKNGDGDWIDVELEDNNFQALGTTLIDFEDGCGAMGNPEMGAVVTGTVPAGDYDGLRFDMGVPFDPNHADRSTAPPPLNVASMHWDWADGYKFLRIDSGEFNPMADWRMHLGSRGCDGDAAAGGTTECMFPNRVAVELESFDPGSDRVVADIAALTDGVALDENQAMTPFGCMAGPTDTTCADLYENLGLPFGEAPAGTQSFFSVE